MRIGERDIGSGLRTTPYVIAEIGVNHDGSVERAMQLTDAAADAGADAVKLQCFEAGRLMSRACALAQYQADAGERDPREMLRRLEMPLHDMARIVARAHDRGIHAIVTVFSLELVGPAAALPWDAFKTASPDIIHKPMLEALQQDGRPMIVSTGAAEMDEVRRAVAWLGEARAARRLALLQCVSAYPTGDEHAAMGGIGALMDAFGLPTGYSDHTTGVDSGGLAVECGACILEKHLTYSNSAPGPDHAASLEHDAFTEYVRRARAARTGDPQVAWEAGGAPADRAVGTLGARARSDVRVGPRAKRVLPCERDVRLVSRQSLVSARALAPGHTLARTDLTIKRPGAGLAPYALEGAIGRRLARAVEADTPLTEADLA